MKKNFSLLSLSTALCLVAGQASADLISISQVGLAGFPSRKVTPAESSPNPGGAAPADGDVYQWIVTTDADILSINQIAILNQDGQPLNGLYNNSFGDPANAEPGNSALAGFTPSITVDSWITTPGLTARLGPDLPGDGSTTFGDTTNNGAQTGFQFAQLTVPAGTIGTFNGRISIASTINPGESFVQPFTLLIGIPEPATLAMAGLGLIGIVATARRRS